MSADLPVQKIRADLGPALERGPLVVTSPTGSGKSTQVPRWCPGRVLVVEPRRVACRSLAQRVAELEESPLGEAVGFTVRDESRASEDTRILFATPGIALRIRRLYETFDTIILDEFHERSLDIDLLLGLLKRRFRGHLVVMSATLDGERLARHLAGTHLHAAGRAYPVETRYVPGGRLLPEVRGLEERLLQALEDCRGHPGDVLVFLPGKGEIVACRRILGGRRDDKILELHGGLSLAEQTRVFQPCERRKVVLATNVAETSLTLPGIGVVIDSGLVRQTRYRGNRGYLSLVPIAMDSADQRAGRAGRTGPGLALRLWDPAAQLEARTLPELRRESLVPLVLGAAVAGEIAAELPLLDPPGGHAFEVASEELRRLGALDTEDRVTELGKQLYGLPLDVALGRLLVEASGAAGSTLDDVIDLVSGLATHLRPTPPREGTNGGADITCDAVALIRAVRSGETRNAAWAESRRLGQRLRRAYGRGERPSPETAIARRHLVSVVMAADPRCVHIARRRGRRIAWSNGGTELELARDSAAAGDEDLEAIAVLDTHAVGKGGRGKQLLATRVMPLPMAWLLEEGLGRDRLAGATVDAGVALAKIERVYARRVLDTREEIPRGALARQTLADLFLRGEIFPGGRAEAEERLSLAQLAREAATAGELVATIFGEVPFEVEPWVRQRLASLGVESGEDLALLSPADLLPPSLPPDLLKDLDRRFPSRLQLPGAAFEIRYDVPRCEAVLVQIGGSRREPPPLMLLPRLPGFRLVLEHKGAKLLLRD